MRIVILLLIALASISEAQTLASWDGSGNAMLNGTYNFREVVWDVGYNSGDLADAFAVFGAIKFDGNGNYTVTCQYLDSTVSASAQTCPSGLTGMYRVSGGGIARVASFVNSGTVIEGLVSNGVLVGSATEANYNDLFIGALAGDTPNVGTMNTKYWVSDFDIPTGLISTARDSLFAANFDGAGNLGTVSATGYIGANGASVITQNISGVRYSFSNGVGTFAFGGSLSTSNLLAGNRQFYVSQDGSLIFGGSTTGFDMLVGIRATSGTAPASLFNGLYYQAGAFADETALSAGFVNLETHYSSFVGNGSLLAGHYRLFSVFADGAFDYTYTQPYTFTADATYEDAKNLYHYVVGDGGRFQIGQGIGPNIGVNLAMKADFSGSGVYISPGLIVNAASFAPSTAGVSRGELVTIYGSNLAQTSLVDPTFPTSLGGALVLVNSRPAPIYEISPTRVTVQIPFTTTEATSTFQVVSNGTPSNSVVVYTNTTSPGVFLTNGIYAAATHADFTLITPDKPAAPGETVVAFVTGLGDVSPALAAGTPAPQDPLSKTANMIYVFIDGKQATTSYVGLAPGFVGLYQINVAVPADATSGDVSFDLSTADAYQSSALLSVGAAPLNRTAAPVSRARPRPHQIFPTRSRR